MSLYALSSQQTSTSPASGKVLLEDLPLTIDDAARVQRIKANGLACLGRIHGDVTWEDWMGAGAAMEIITEEALAAVNASQWDKDNKQAVNEFNRRWDTYEAGAGRNHKPLSKQERSALRTVMDNSVISAWRATLTGLDKRRLNHPNAVLNRFKAQAKAKATPSESRQPSPYAQQKAANIAGAAVLREDVAVAVLLQPMHASVVIHTFDGLSNKPAKVEAIARELSAWVKAQKMAAQ
jgi:hypothetical protein